MLSSRIMRSESDSSSVYREQRHRGLAADIDGLSEVCQSSYDAATAHGRLQDQSKTWQNLILYLSATSGVCLYDRSLPRPPFLCQIIGRGLLPRIYDEEADPHIAIETFLRQCVDLLVSDSIHVRETAKEALGNELPLTLCGLLVMQMTK